ncbi:hypothetical protein FHL15_009921 [Xylaria flabelliformis]|uniref:Uncharacterized protein n=1 Tax=Xylaria flabelliformis TaxID=2512241 RepID=A0A553HMN9_9PEZI|nr:hypothetical protein FHL15_009921 [Xylaria flabelliformis]
MAAVQGQDPVPPCWIPHPLTALHGPKSWVFYVVADIADRHRPIAVATIPQADTGSMSPAELLLACLHIVSILSDPINELAITSELSIAADFYQDDQGLPLSVYELPKMDSQEILRNLGGASLEEPRVPEFPFISTCLLLSGGLVSGNGLPAAKPLGTVFRDVNPYFGMVVFDISDLKNLKYGIVAFQSQKMVFFETLDNWRRWRDLGQEPDGPQEEKVEEERPRHAMSAKEYWLRFGVTSESYPVSIKTATADAINVLERVSLVDPVAFQLIWPPEQELEAGADRLLRKHSVRPLVDITVRALIDSTLETESFDPSLFDEPRQLRTFKDVLRRILQESSERLGQSHSTAQLIALAFEGETYLDLVRYKRLSANTISAALQMVELSQVRTLAVCVDSLSSSPAELAGVLSTCPTLSEIYLLQSPTRESDEASIECLLEILKHADQNLHYSKLFVSGVYSAVLRRRTWLPATSIVSASIFPVQYIFKRTQVNARGRPKKYWNWRSYFVGDGLLTADQFAAGFLRWLRAPDDYLFRFAAGPPTLKDEPISRIELTPIPAENFVSRGYSKSLLPTRERFVRGSWHVLVSNEKHWDRETHDNNVRTGGWAATEFNYVRFAFVQVLTDLDIQAMAMVTATTTTTTPGRFRREDIAVLGLKEFLNAMGGAQARGAVESEVVEKRLREVGESLARAYGQGRQPDDLEVIGVMSQDDACEALNEMLEASNY